MAGQSARRLSLLFEAGQGRYAVEATSVVEVAPASMDSDSLRGVLALSDLSALLGGAKEERPGMAVVLDVSPTLTLRVRKILEAADLAGCPVFRLPRGLPETLSQAVRGAVLYQERLFLELVPEGLLSIPDPKEPYRPVRFLEEPPDRALLFESQGRLLGIPLAWVSQVVPASDAFCPNPSPEGSVAGLFPYLQELWPIYSAPALLGATASREALFVLAEVAGQQAGLSAARVLGVYEEFSRTQRQGEFTPRRLGVAALFLDLQAMFS